MRKITKNQFLKILKGEDLEFRISPFKFTLSQKASINGIHCPYDLSFQGCDLGSLIFEGCRFSGNIMIDNSSIKSLTFDECQLHDIRINLSSIGSFSLAQSNELKQLIVKTSDINTLTITDNPIYEVIHIGCENNVRSCTISNNGDASRNSFSTRVFICPEKFEGIVINNLTTDALHIGTFGEYARFTVTDVRAEVVLIDGCSTELSKVSFKNVRPIDASASALHFINTTFDQEIFGDKAFKNYKSTKIHHQQVDVSALMSK